MAMASMLGMGGKEAVKAFQRYTDSLTADRVVQRLSGPQEQSEDNIPDLMSEDEQDRVLKMLTEKIANL